MSGVFVSEPYGWTSLAGTPAHDYLLPAIKRLLPTSRGGEQLRVLDLGCGNGYVASRLHALGYCVTGVDVSPDGIALAAKAYPEVRFEVTSVYDDVRERLNEADFDVVVSSEVIEHLYLPRKLLENAYSALRPGGTLIVTTPYHGYLKNLALSILNRWDDHHTVQWDGGHIKFFSERSLRVMLEATGFTRVWFSNAGRVRWLWKSMACRAERSSVNSS